MTAEDISVATTVDDLFALPEEEDVQPDQAPVEYVSQENTGDPVDWDKFDAEIAPPKTDGKVKPFKTVKERAAEARGEAPKTKAAGGARATKGAQAKQAAQKDLSAPKVQTAKVKAEKAPKPVKVKAEKAPPAPKPPKVVAIPATLDKMPKDVQAAFQADYPAALAEGVRRGKSDRGDFAAGYLMAYRRFSLRSASGSDAVSKAS